jgi:hypothetical protein
LFSRIQFRRKSGGDQRKLSASSSQVSSKSN